MNEVDTGSIGSFKFPNFLAMMLRKIDEISAEAEIREAFKVFDSVRIISYDCYICDTQDTKQIFTSNWSISLPD